MTFGAVLAILAATAALAAYVRRAARPGSTRPRRSRAE
jgi:hypothetical protein